MHAEICMAVSNNGTCEFRFKMELQIAWLSYCLVECRWSKLDKEVSRLAAREGTLHAATAERSNFTGQ